MLGTQVLVGDELRLRQKLLRMNDGVVSMKKLCCSVEERWQGRQCIHPVDYVKSVHIGERIDLDLRRMICLDFSGSKERKREKENIKPKKRQKYHMPPAKSDGRRARMKSTKYAEREKNIYVYMCTYIYIYIALSR